MLSRWAAEELWHIGPKRQANLDGTMSTIFLIELRNSATNLTGAESYHWIFVGIVIDCAMEDFDSKGSLFEVVTPPRKRPLNHVAQESGIAPAVLKRSACQNPFELLLNLQTVMFGDWIPVPASCSDSHHGRAKSSSGFARQMLQLTTSLLQAQNHLLKSII